MAEYTPNLNLKKMDPDDFYNIEDFNYNLDRTDNHDHDNKYYTKQEAGEKFEEKAKLKEAAYRNVSNIPTEGSTMLITSGAMYNALGNKASTSHTHTKSQMGVYVQPNSPPVPQGGDLWIW